MKIKNIRALNNSSKNEREQIVQEICSKNKIKNRT
jgi:hypothetical protein